ncbi:MAG: hypothetical protein HYW23_02100 [Candidatus Aenigmarchaeota archaeon]|nr:hypothetical protein [Candidatus Aenigmarchaeota archaeon]
MKYLERNPSPEKMRRGILLIEALLNQFSWYEDAASVLKFYPNWRTDYKDYSAAIHEARNIARKPYRFVTEGEGPVGGGWSGEWGHVESKWYVNWSELIEKAVEGIYEREQRQGISQEEIRVRFLQADANGEDLDRVFAEIEARLPRSKDEIRASLSSKLLKYSQKHCE